MSEGTFSHVVVHVLNNYRITEPNSNIFNNLLYIDGQNTEMMTIFYFVFNLFGGRQMLPPLKDRIASLRAFPFP